MTIRGYCDEDREACRSLWVELTQWHRDIYDALEIGGDDPGTAFDEHLASVGPENLWVAEEDGRVVGLTGMIVTGDVAELEPVVVSVGCRGQGIGSALAEAVIGRARELGLRQVLARPVARNVEALAFFHDRGFNALGQVELVLDLVDPGRWKPGASLAGRKFGV